ncbi:fungal-specific transcription factor domain-containing protein [Aspergillus unguis]
MMDHDPDRLSAASSGMSKRIRQACASCRRRKTKCSGERPVCFHCRRSRQRCVYEPYSTTISDTSAVPPPAVQDNTAILQRINMLESRLAELSDRAVPQPLTSPTQNGFPSTSPQRFSSGQCSLPPPPVLQSLIDTFFVHVHNRPYSYIQEASFRRKLELGIVPNCLLLVVLAAAVRFSTHEYYQGRKQEAIEVYAKGSWMSVLTEHLTVVDNLTVEVVQTLNMLAIVDYTVGHVSSAWLKVGLAARISQDLRLMIDPSDALPFPEQEERRRTFWSGYLLDRLISCGKSRPLCFHDDDCHVRLPCDEETLRTGQVQPTHTLHELLRWDSEIYHDQPPSPFGLVILMASIFGRCTRYMHRECNPDKTPPWDTNSEFSKINSSLLLLESYSRNRRLSPVDALRDREFTDQSEAEQVLFAHTLFHLCHCLLNHPFLLRLRLKPFGSKVPASFALRVLQTASEHANQLVELLRDASDAGSPLGSSFYPYCLVVVGVIQSLVYHYEVSKNIPHSSDTLDYFHYCFSTLERLSETWGHAANMTVRLRDFHAQGHVFSSLLDPACITDEIDTNSVNALWTMLDYGLVGSRITDSSSASPGDGPGPNFSASLLSNMPSPSSWVLGSDIFNTTSLGMGDADTTDPHLLGGLTPCTQFTREVDTLLNPC